MARTKSYANLDLFKTSKLVYVILLQRQLPIWQENNYELNYQHQRCLSMFQVCWHMSVSFGHVYMFNTIRGKGTITRKNQAKREGASESLFYLINWQFTRFLLQRELLLQSQQPSESSTIVLHNSNTIQHFSNTPS